MRVGGKLLLDDNIHPDILWFMPNIKEIGTGFMDIV